METIKEKLIDWWVIVMVVFVGGIMIGLLVPKHYEPRNEDVPVKIEIGNKVAHVTLDQVLREDENQLSDDNYWFTGWI